MKKVMSKGVFAVASLLVAGLAQAGPPVTVTFKNLGSQNAELKLVTANETSTYQIAKPQPARTVRPNDFVTFDVQRIVSPDVNGAQLRYASGGKTCAFGTTYLMRTLPGGIKQPQWTKTATPSGGATCTATITRTSADYSWAVEFTMK
ncbi:cupredoxin domain-containing protein [Pseudomonas fakonensis]|uniref:Cupredoxin domain-containing protein n=1 Tax=Pseudomonas fakonensis TaxID=2842355 RepID=A0ABX8N7V1_9PSED|nr:cupredoxin domain-containing protein [Pseudomonas fakonensis]QXH52418.1 cupredoxin domain-containing protein [Pseudomonas fakonensis]